MPLWRFKLLQEYEFWFQLMKVASKCDSNKTSLQKFDANGKYETSKWRHSEMMNEKTASWSKIRDNPTNLIPRISLKAKQFFGEFQT